MRAPLRSIAALVALILSAPASAESPPQDPYFGEALFYAYQGEFFRALERLDTEIAQHYGVDERRLDPLFVDIDRAEFSVGDFELNYRMHQRAGRAMRAVLEADVPDPIRADATYRLARLHFHKGRPEEALAVLDRLPRRIPDSIVNDAAFLRANVLMALGRPEDAVDVLEGIQRVDAFAGFSEYNLGIAFLESGEIRAAVDTLDRAGRIAPRDRESRAIRDKSNLVLGSLLFEAGELERARSSLDRVRLDGMHSNVALLRAGWTEASRERFDRAVVPWSLLAERDSTDEAVQEALLALPFAYGKLSVHGRAAVLYEQAARSFGDQLARLSASITSIENGDFLKRLEGEEIRQDRDWVVHMRSMSDAPETFYLVSLMAEHPFQAALQNYLDLTDMRRTLLESERSLDAFEDLIRARRSYYAPRLPVIDTEFRRLDAKMRLRLEQRDSIERRLYAMLTAPAPRMLATAEEQEIAARLDAVRARLDAPGAPEGPAAEQARAHLRRLEGLLTWHLETEYHARLTEAHDALRDLTGYVEALEARYASFVRIRQAAQHGFEGYSDRIADLRSRARLSIERIEQTRDHQGKLLEAIALQELRLRRDRLLDYQDKARFAFADSYDRALKAKAE